MKAQEVLNNCSEYDPWLARTVASQIFWAVSAFVTSTLRPAAA